MSNNFQTVAINYKNQNERKTNEVPGWDRVREEEINKEKQNFIRKSKMS